MKVIWSSQAKRDYFNILEYLHEKWSLNEVRKFIDRTDEIIGIIKINPKTFIESSTKKNVRKGLVTRHNTLFYKVRTQKKEIILLTFWDNRKDPQKLNY